MRRLRYFYSRVLSKDLNMAGLPRITPTAEEYDMERVLLVSKLTCYQNELKNHPGFSVEQLDRYLMENDSEHYIKTHQTHKNFERNVIDALKNVNVDVKLVERQDLSEKLINWADTIISVGGDGTYLMAASRIRDQSKPLIGLNSCPDTSTGFLCLPKTCSKNVAKTIIDIKNRCFTWAYRTRIHLKLTGHNIVKKWKSIHEADNIWNPVESNNVASGGKEELILPHLALNEVFVAERSPAHVTFLDISMNNELIKTKSSGIIVCTGSGSTSWNFTMNRISSNVVKKIFDLSGFKGDIDRVVDLYNQSLKFDQDDERLHFTIRDLIPTATWPSMPNVPETGYTTKIIVNSIMKDGYLIIDGSISYPFNLGTAAIMESSPQYALKTINLFSTAF